MFLLIASMFLQSSPTFFLGKSYPHAVYAWNGFHDLLRLAETLRFNILKLVL